jgi:cellulose synthase/poly-beta-1,6-N-acetylglucosamine synthase-like glycosyltransferase
VGLTTIAGAAVLAASALGLALVVLGYPAWVWLASRGRPRPGAGSSEPPRRVTAVVAVRNGAELIGEKIDDLLALTPPDGGLEIIISSDGSTDATAEIARSRADRGVVVIESDVHAGKAAALNRAVEQATGDVILLTDADARLEPQALDRLLAHFADAGIGGVCGRRMIGERGAALADAQAGYISLDSALKGLESRRGSITSNDGKIYAIRRELFEPIPGDVTDDLYTALCVVERGRRFVYEPEARAWIRVPSRSPGHEISRRRRVVARSLRGIWRRRAVLDPFRYGSFAIGLFINKVLRRGLPLFLAGLLAGSLLLAVELPWAWWLVGGQAVAWAAALLALLVGHRLRALRAATSAATLVCVGSWGTLLGLVDFLCQRSVTKWNPVKSG